MKDHCYLILNERGIVGFKKKPPDLKGDERAICVSVEVPDHFFDYTFVRKNIVITDEDMMNVPSAEVEILHAADKL